MIIIPAIDIKEGRCVRLEQGKMSRETVYSEFPEEIAVKWHEAGAERLHIVDLDGAIEGRPVNRDVIAAVVNAVPIPIQLGGGIRDTRTIESYLDLGIGQIILGTAAHKDPELVVEACRQFPGKVIVGIDSRNGRVAVEGWIEEINISPSDLARKYESIGISAIVYTDIQRDGMRTGPNIEATKTIAESVDVPVIASGGISGIDDVENLLSLSKYGVEGMIVGKALYEGSLDLADAIKMTKK